MQKMSYTKIFKQYFPKLHAKLLQIIILLDNILSFIKLEVVTFFFSTSTCAI